MGADHHPDYAEIARLEREVFGSAPEPEPEPEPELPLVSALPAGRCAMCGNHWPRGAVRCNHCQSEEWRADDE